MITLIIENGIAYVWNTDDWYTLRSEYHICGALIGSLPSFPRQNDFMGLPMALLSEETALLVEKGICEIIEMPKIIESPSEDKEEIESLQQKILEEQRNALRQRRIEQLSQKIDVIVAGKRQKLMSRGIADIQLDKQKILEDEISKLPTLSPVHTLVHLPTEHFINTEKKKATIDVLKPSVVDKNGHVRYSIFKDLWERSYYLTDGMKFGCDFLVYTGDPVKFHAKYMVRCVFEQTVSLQLAALVAFGRLSVSVNKLAVLAVCNKDNQIEYQTMQWHESVNSYT